MEAKVRPTLNYFNKFSNFVNFVDSIDFSLNYFIT